MFALLLFVAGFTSGSADVSVMSLVNFTGQNTYEGPSGKIYIICETSLPDDCDKLSWEPRRDNADYIEKCNPEKPPSKKTVRFKAMDMAQYHTCSNVTVHMLNVDNLLVKDVFWEGETVQCIDYNHTDSAYTHSAIREDLSTFNVTLSVTYSEKGILDLYLSLKDVVIEGDTMCNKSLITPHAVPVLDIRFEDNHVVCSASQLAEDSGLVCTILMFKDNKMVAKTPKNDTSNTLSSPFTKNSLAGFQCEANCRIPGIDGEITDADKGQIIVTKVISVNKVMFWVLISIAILIIIVVIVLCVVWWRRWGHKMRYWNWRTWSFYAPMPTADTAAEIEEYEAKDEAQATQEI